MLVETTTLFTKDSNALRKMYKIVDRGPAGGWIFYNKGNYSNGWMVKSILGTHGISIGTGKVNTKAIIKICKGSKITAKLCIAYSGAEKATGF